MSQLQTRGSLLKLLITGSRGYVAKNLITELNNNHPEVRVMTLNRVSRKEPFLFSLHDELIEKVADIRSPDFFNGLYLPDHVLSIAADTSKLEDPQSVSDLVAANSMLPALLASHLSNKNINFIHMGTFSHKSDSSEYDPQTFYSATKFAGEKLLEFFSRNKRISLTILHTYDIYGPKQPHRRLIPTIIEKLEKNQEIHIVLGSQEFRPVYIDDVIRALLGLIYKPTEYAEDTVIYDLYGPETFRIAEIPGEIATILGYPLSRIQLKIVSKSKYKEIMHFRPCHALPELPVEWTRIEAGIRKMTIPNDSCN